MFVVLFQIMKYLRSNMDRLELFGSGAFDITGLSQDLEDG